MSTKANSDLWGSAWQTFRNARDANLKLQQEMFHHWSRFWFSEPEASWTRPVERFGQQWTKTANELLQQQVEVVQSQVRAAWDSLDATLGIAAPTAPAASAAVPSLQPAAQPRGEAEEQPEPQASGKHELPLAEDTRVGSVHIVNKVAIVTGAASGIGEAVVRELARRGARTVVMVDYSDRVREVAAAINAVGQREVTVAVVGDTTDDAFRRRVYDDVIAQHGIPTICVPAAGITRDALCVKVDKQSGQATIYPIETFRQVVEVNLLAPIYWAIEMVARIAEDRCRRGLGRWEPEEDVQGSIVLLGSVSSQGNKGQISYAATKAGLEGAGATLMKEAIFHGVRCGIIHPGFTDTPMARALGEEFLHKYVLPFTQLRRLIRPEEIADAICFMIANSAVSGELWADAGWHPPA